MVRPFVIVGLVWLLMATGVAFADPAGDVRLPMIVDLDEEATDKATEVVVEEGDHLWLISEKHVGSHHPDIEVAPYWLRVIEVNEESLRSGDPDLIYPGEVIRLPEVSELP